MSSSPAQLSSWLHQYSNARKTYLRPYICPFDALLDEIADGASLYDIGCGGGAWLALAAHFRQVHRLGGYDVAAGPVAAARTLLATATPEAAHNLEIAVDLNFPAALSEFNTVSVIDVFHHVPPTLQPKFLPVLFDRMQPGARLIFKDIDRSHPLVLANKLHDRLLSGAAGHEATAADIRTALIAAGFQIESAGFRRMFVYPHYWFIAAKPTH